MMVDRYVIWWKVIAVLVVYLAAGALLLVGTLRLGWWLSQQLGWLALG